MRHSNVYMMESKDETFRLEVKTDPEAVRQQAIWCGIKPGLRVLDVGCGPGKTTSILHEMVQPGGSIVGIDFSQERIAYAKKHYGNKAGIDFVVCNLTEPLKSIGQFDLIWVRFVLEYFRAEGKQIVKNLSEILKTEGYLCLLDLDYNCLSHYELPSMIQDLLPKLMERLAHQAGEWGAWKKISILTFTQAGNFTPIYSIRDSQIYRSVSWHIIYCMAVSRIKIFSTG